MGKALFAALAAALAWLSFIRGVKSQNNEVVFTSVVYARIGERTPIIGNGYWHLTSYGANQMYNLVCKCHTSSRIFNTN
jgi:hypothetical protein